MCPAITIELTSEAFTAAAAKLRASHGISVDTTQPTGEIDDGATKASWAYDGTTLTINVLSRPWYASCGTVVKDITEFFGG
jgi:hypothetical protein